MPEAAAVINTGGGSGGGIGSIPGGWRTVVIAGGALAALVAVVLQKRGGGSDGAATSGGLSTSANIALGQVAYNQLQAQGEARAAAADTAGRLQRLQDSTSAGFGGLWAQGQATQAQITQTGAMNEVIARQIWGYQQGLTQEELLGQQALILGHADMTIANTLAAPPPWTTSYALADGPLGGAAVDDEPDVEAGG